MIFAPLVLFGAILLPLEEPRVLVGAKERTARAVHELRDSLANAQTRAKTTVRSVGGCTVVLIDEEVGLTELRAQIEGIRWLIAQEVPILGILALEQIPKGLRSLVLEKGTENVASEYAVALSSRRGLRAMMNVRPFLEVTDGQRTVRVPVPGNWKGSLSQTRQAANPPITAEEERAARTKAPIVRRETPLTFHWEESERVSREAQLVAAASVLDGVIAPLRQERQAAAKELMRKLRGSGAEAFPDLDAFTGKNVDLKQLGSNLPTVLWADYGHLFRKPGQAADFLERATVRGSGYEIVLEIPFVGGPDESSSMSVAVIRIPLGSG